MKSGRHGEGARLQIDGKRLCVMRCIFGQKCTSEHLPIQHFVNASHSDRFLQPRTPLRAHTSKLPDCMLKATSYWNEGPLVATKGFLAFCSECAWDTRNLREKWKDHNLRPASWFLNIFASIKIGLFAEVRNAIALSDQRNLSYGIYDVCRVGGSTERRIYDYFDTLAILGSFNLCESTWVCSIVEREDLRHIYQRRCPNSSHSREIRTQAHNS